MLIKTHKKALKIATIVVLLILALFAAFLHPLGDPSGLYEYPYENYGKSYLLISEDGSAFLIDVPDVGGYARSSDERISVGADGKGNALQNVFLFRYQWQKTGYSEFIMIDNEWRFRSFVLGINRDSFPSKLKRCFVKSPMLQYILNKIERGEIYWEEPWPSIPGVTDFLPRGAILSDEEILVPFDSGDISSLDDALRGRPVHMQNAIRMLDTLYNSERMNTFDKKKIQLMAYHLTGNETIELLDIAQKLYPQTTWWLPPDLKEYTRITNSSMRVSDAMSFPYIAIGESYGSISYAHYIHEYLGDKRNVYMSVANSFSE